MNDFKNTRVIEPVTEPSDWCSPMHPVLKKHGKVRITVDYKKLNQSVKRQQHMLPNLEDVAPRMAGSTVFSSLDACSGYYQIPLDPESSHLTTFITPFGRFRRIPMGISMAPEKFQKEMSDMLEGIEGCEVIMDDICVHGRNEEEHDRRLEQVLRRIAESGLKLNMEKCHIKKSSLLYFGHIVSKDGIQANPEKVEAIGDMDPPNDVGELRTLLGMINYLGRFLPRLSSTLQPLNELLREDKAWVWGSAQQQAFNQVKAQLTSLPALAYYRPDLATVVSADASSYGVGGVLLQRHGSQLLPVMYCSRTLTEIEKRVPRISLGL